MSRQDKYTRQVVLQVGNSDPAVVNSSKALLVKWAEIHGRDASNHEIVNIFNDADPEFPNKINNGSTRLYVVGHGVANNSNFIYGNNKLENERLSPADLADKISKMIDRTKIGNRENPL